MSKPIDYSNVLVNACPRCGMENEASMHGGDKIFSFYCKKHTAIDRCSEPCTFEDWRKCPFNELRVEIKDVSKDNI